MQEPSLSASRDDDSEPVLPGSEQTSANMESAARPATDDRAQAQSAPSSLSSVGRKLAAAREEQRLSVREASERLHVVPRYVTAIETGHYATLPGVVFLKGYVRAYSRVVGLDEDALARDLEEELRQRDDIFDHAAHPLPFEPVVKNYSSAVLAAIFVVALICLGVYIWSVDHTATVDPVKAALGSDSAAVEAARSADESLDTGSAETDQNQSAMSSEHDAIGQVGEPGQAFAEAETDLEFAGGEQVEEFGSIRRGLYDSNEESTADPAGDQSALDSVEATADAAPDGGEPIGGSGAEVNVVFTGDCWFDIRAGNDERTVGLYRAGQTIKFTGPFPMEVVVGAVGVTQMTVDGRPLDFSDFPVRNNRVEFTINSQTRL